MEVAGGVEISLPTANEVRRPVTDWIGIELMENTVYLLTKVEWRADEDGEWNLHPRGYVHAEGWLYMSEDGWRAFGVLLASGEDPVSLFEGAWQLVWQAGFEFADQEFDDVTTNLRVAMAGRFNLPSENVRMRLPPFLLEQLGGLELVRRAVADLTYLTLEEAMVHQEYYRVFLEMGPFNGEQRYEVLRILRAVFTTKPRAPVVSDEVLWGVVRREAGEKQRDNKEGERTSAVDEAGSSEGGLKRIVATLTRTLNKNQGYLADAKKKLTFDGANITEFLIDYENLAALLKWSEEEKMDHVGQHVSLSLGRDIMTIVASSGSWKETRNEMMRKYLKAEKMATEDELAAVQRKNYATYDDFLRAFTLVALRIPGVTDRIMSRYFLRQFSEFDKDKILSAYQKTNKFEYTRDVDFSIITDLAEKTVMTETLALLKEGEVIDLTGKTRDKVKKGIKNLHERVHGVDNKIERVKNVLLLMQAQVSRPALPPQEAVVPAAVANRGYGWRDPANEQCKYCTMIGHFVRTCPRLNHDIMRQRCSRSLKETQRRMLAVAGDMFPEKCEPYINDNPIKGAQNKDETEVQPGIRKFVWDHLQDIKDLLQRFLVYNITASGPKNILVVPKVTIPGFRCGAYGRKPDPAKTDKTFQWPTPLRTTTEVRVFLGVVGFLRIFIKGFAKIAEPIRAMIREGGTMEWTEDKEAAVQTLKDILVSYQVTLAAPCLNDEVGRPFILETDGGPLAVGGVLIQGSEEGKGKPIRFESRTLNSAERRYSQFKKEVLTILHCLKTFQAYLFGRRFILRIDSTNVVRALKNYKLIDPTIGRWIGFIWQFDYKVERIAGLRNRADGLSWVCITPERVEDAEPIDAFLEYEGGTLVADNEMMSLVCTPGQLLIQTLEKGAPTVVAERREGLVTTVRRKDEKDSWGATMGPKEELMAMAVEGGRNVVMCLIETWTRRERQYLVDIIQAMHDGLAGGYRLSKGTLAKIAPLYLWPGMAGMVAIYSQTCLIYQERSSTRVFEPLRPTRVLGPGHLVHLDLAVMPVSTKGYRYILDVRDNLSNYVEAIALKRKTEKGVADWIEDFYLRHPFVRRFIVDNGTEFVNHEVLSRLKMLDVPIKIIEPYHPEANAPVERGNQTLKNTIAKLAADDLGNWLRYIEQAIFSDSMTPKRTTRCIPTELWYEREIDFPVEALVPTWNRLDDNPHMSAEELIVARCQQVVRNEEALEDVVKRVMDSRVRDKARRDQVKNIRKEPLQVGEMTLVRISALESTWSVLNLRILTVLG
ncbi:hypothetical protein CBR_g25972 [Chara braunii]|uniref:Integrase catalytic domain-containing protein n=1 Tax=Chara braunii TaxID=69332 RepID=A0A388L6W2_CHABU|nr:hypothetical protein CBR_g25972 [Chara braunii]|eukprot:GBG78037.1 hypothetical protein CBR_g25972 [Chara braunii]